MPITVATQRFFKELENAPPAEPFSQMSITKFRQLGKEFEALMGEPAPGIQYDDFKPIQIQINKNEPIDLKIFTPPNFVEPGRAIIYFAGCGYASELDMHWAAASNIAVNANCKLIMVKYPLAPENKFPEAYKVGFDATQFLLAEYEAYGLDLKQIILAGDSSGGNLCALVVNELYRSTPFRIALQVLISPWTDISMQTYYHTNFKNEQMQDKLLTESIIVHYKQLYLPDEYTGKEPEVSPLYQQDIAQLGLPKTLIMAGEYDGLRGETEAYYELLCSAGVQVKKNIWAGHTHNAMIARKVLNDGVDPALVLAQEINELLSKP